ncbi:MAG: cobalt ABC transporter permease [Coriobacteriia bacterium]|jgi:ABC-type thiamin/hydroxymethylpyrimidine transport system permease subunit|nr:cobalt ABC transporter permease [Coriobacteriia bacterium]
MRAAEPARTVWGLSLRSRIVIALIAAMIVTAKFYLRIPLHVPGHSGIFWMALLLIGVGIVHRPGAGTLIGFLSGLLAIAVLPGREGILIGLKYFAPGLVMDVMWITFAGRFDKAAVAMLAGAAANIAKLSTSYVIGLLAGIPHGYLALGLGVAATSHLVFGALGGWVGSIVVRRLDRTGVIDRRPPSPQPEAKTA